MALRPALLLLLCCAAPSLSASSQLVRLWSFVSGSDQSVYQGENYRIVPGDVSSVIYEEYNGTSDSEHILVSSFDDPLATRPQVQFHLSTDVQGTVAFKCQEPGMRMHIVSYITGKSPATHLKFDNETGQVHFTMNDPSSPDDGLFGSTLVHITVYTTPGQLAAGSTVVLNNSNARLVVGEDTGGHCNFANVVSSAQRPAADKCAERSVACEQDCSALTGLCACDHGYVVDTVNPEKCLETHTVSLEIPGVEKRLDQFDVSHGDIELLLASQFNQLNGGGVHQVAILENDVNVTTITSRAHSALQHAHRLRRSLMMQTSSHMPTALDLDNIRTIRVLPTHGVRSRGKRQTIPGCSGLLTVLQGLVPGGVDLSVINLPTAFDLETLCVEPGNVLTAGGTVTLSIPVPDALASTLLPDQLQLKATQLILVVATSPVSVQSLTARTIMVVGTTDVAVTISFDVSGGSGSGQAVMTGQATGLSISDIFSVFSPSLASSTGLDGIMADEVGFEVTFGRGTPTRFFFRLVILSARDLVGNLIGASGLPDDGLKSALEAANLDAFDITNVEFLVTNEGGRLCIKVSGNPVLPGFDGVTMSTEIKAIDVGTPNRSVSFAFGIDGSLNLATAIKGFIPTLDLTGIPGFSSLQLPEFSIAFSKPRLGLPPLPTLPDFGRRLPNVRVPNPKFNLPRLKIPGINFNANFRPMLPGFTGAFSIGGRFGMGPLCLNLRNEDTNAGAKLTAILQILFPSLDPANLGLPETFQDLINVEILKLCFDYSKKTFSAAVRMPGRINLIQGNRDYFSLTNTTVQVVIVASSKPVKFDISAQSSVSVGGLIPFLVTLNRDRSGKFVFSATPVQAVITTSDIARTFAGAGGIGAALADLKLSDLTLSNLRMEVFNDTSLIFRFTATVSYRQLPSVTFEIVYSNPFRSNSLLALGISTTSATLAQVVSSVIPKADISDVPFVSDITIPAISFLLTTRNNPVVIQQLPFLAADLKELASHVSSARISLLLPVTFPRVGRKNFVGAFRGISFDFTPPDATTSLMDIAQLALPGVNLAALTPPAGLPGLANVFLDRLFLDVPKKTFCVEARLAGQMFDVIPSVLSMDNIMFNLCLARVNRITQRNLMVAGNINFGQVAATVQVQEMRGRFEASATIPQRMTIADILQSLGGSFLPGSDAIAGILRGNGFDSFGLTDTVFRVKRDSGVNMASIMTSADLPGGVSAQVEVLFAGLGTTARTTVAVFTTDRIELATIIELLSGVDIRGLPFLGDLALPASTISIASTTLSALPSGFTFTDPLVSAKFAKGVSFNYLQEIAGQAKTFKMSLRPSSFDINLEEFPSLEEGLALFFPGIANLDIYRALPSIIPGVFGLRINRIAYNKMAGKLSVEAALSDFVLIPNLLEITMATVKAEITKTPMRNPAGAPSASQLTLSIEGDVNLFGLTLAININYNQRTKAFGIRITSPTGAIKFEKLFELIGSATNDLTNPAVAALQLGKSSIVDPLFEVNKRSGSLAFRIRGTPTITGFGLFTAEALANTQPRQFILTLSAQEFSMVSMIETLTGLDLSGIFFLGLLRGPSNIGITLSATNVPRIPFPILSYPLNETTSIDRGLGFTVAFRLPADCAGDPICNFFQLILGSQAIIFRVTGINGPQATIAYRLPAMLSLGPVKLYNVDFGFSVSATKPPTVGLTNIEMDVPVPFPADGQQPLHFRGRLLIDPTSNVEASLQMIGIYERAFGIPILSFGNVDLGFRTNIGCPICVSQLRFGGELALGQNCYRGNKANCVIAQAIFNIDAVDVKNNYFYFAVNQLSYRKVLTSVGIPDIPALVILDAVNMRDVEASYSSIDRNIPSGILPGGKTIKAGLVFKGIFNVLFLVNVKVDVAVELLFGVPKSVNALVEVDPIILGPLRITAASDPGKGPKFELKATALPPSFFFSLDGKISISILQLTASVQARIDDTGLFLQVTGPIFGFPSTFTLLAQFVSLRNPTSFTNFQVKGCFSTLGAHIVNGVRNALAAAQRAVRASLDRAVADLAAADRAVADAVGQLNIKGAAEREARRKLDDAKAALQRAENTVRGLCGIRDCNGCQNVPKPCIVQRCACTIPYPCCRRWSCSTCCRTVCIPTPSFCGTHCVPWVDPVCVTANTACEVLRAAAFAVRVAAQATLTAAQKTVEGAAAATALATTAVGNARVLSRAARGVSDGFLATFNAIGSALSGLLSAFQIRSACFDVLVNSAGGGRIHVSLSVIAAGSTHTIAETINLRNIYDFALKLARRFYGQFF